MDWVFNATDTLKGEAYRIPEEEVKNYPLTISTFGYRFVRLKQGRNRNLSQAGSVPDWFTDQKRWQKRCQFSLTNRSMRVLLFINAS
jgi:hypothetical protein